MERDFLGIGGQNSGALMEQENRGGRMDSAVSIGSPAPWPFSNKGPFSNKASALQQFMSFETPQEAKHKQLSFDTISGIQPIASIDTFEASWKACVLQAPEKSLEVEGRGVMQFATHAYQNQGTDAYRAPTRQLNDARFATAPHSSFPIAMTSPFLKSHGSSNGLKPTATAVKQQPLGSVVAGALTPRNVLKPLRKKAQLTLFYAGSVNVYDDVPCDMAKAIMLMASKECKPAANTVQQRLEASVLSFSKGMVSDGLRVTSQTLSNTTDHVVHQCSGLSSTVSIGSHSETGSGPALTNEKAAAKSTSAQISTSQNESSRTISISLGAATADIIMPKAVPQARKASLARFLEKRKERVSNMMPYSCEKKPSDNYNALDDGTPSSKCSSADVSIPSNQKSSWCVGQTKSCSGNGYYPGIKLEM